MTNRRNTKNIGDHGEDLAINFLQKKTYQIITRNFFSRGGEIDIIAWHNKPYFGQTLCFIEVKTRTNTRRVMTKATDKQKQQKIIFTAKQYCKTKAIDIASTPIQFEHISVLLTKNNPPAITHHVMPI